MAAGHLDANGVWLYGEDDSQSTFSALLNIGQDSASDAIGLDRARLTVLEDANVLSSVTVPATVATGWSLNYARGRKRNGVAWVNFSVTRTGSAITVSSIGDMTNTSIVTLSSGWVAASGVDYPTVSASPGRLSAGYVNGNDVGIAATTPGANILTGDTISLSATYPLA